MTVLDSSSHILITGGTGFFGLSILRHLESIGADSPSVTVLSRNPRAFEISHPHLSRKASWLEGDILDWGSLPSGSSFDMIIHAAADSTRGLEISPNERFSQIVSGTQNILRLAQQVGATRFLYASSGGVYGALQPGMDKIPETYMGPLDTLDIQNTYGLAKRTAEHLCAIFGQNSELEIVIARCFSFIGRDLPTDVHFAVGNFLRDALYNERIVVNSDGSAMRSYLDQADLARYLLCLLVRGRAGQAYNVGSDEAVSIRSLAYLVRDIVSPQKQVVFNEDRHQVSIRDRYVPDVSKIKQEFGLSPTIQLTDSVKSMVHALRES